MILLAQLAMWVSGFLTRSMAMRRRPAGLALEAVHGDEGFIRVGAIDTGRPTDPRDWIPSGRKEVFSTHLRRVGWRKRCRCVWFSQNGRRSLKRSQMSRWRR